ncbi:uncharacterized protein LOC122025406 isoform X2 [Zingiber officinale]|uniref:uncharacterized protein LOC122025406 isoform X2 n=1 Tax=Zingiber officinale TaxID=94328 RepID=UPI001C4BD975|nr:uncharacterized protein LOC122025406 isoform X2 [Zingiber officinale]
MFTEGLDEKAISWINQGSNVANKSRSPLTEKYSLDSTVYQQFPSKCNTSFLSSKVLPPVKFQSVLLSPHSHLLVDSEEEESVCSVPEGYYANYSDTFEGGLRSSGDSDLFEKPGQGNFEEEIMSGEYLSCEPEGEAGREQRPTLIRGISKENLRVLIEEKNSSDDEKVKKSLNANTVSDAFSLDDERNGFPNSHVHSLDEFMAANFQELGTPSAPPILANRKECSTSNLDGENKVRLNTDVSSDNPIQPQEVGETSAGNLLVEQNVHAPMSETNLASHISSYNTSVQSAWQTFIAYDACFRLCLNAWARNCIEAPEFLQDECMTLRNAFGLQTFLLHPRGQILGDRIHDERKEGTNVAKGRKIIGQLEVEVKRIRLLAKRRKLRSISSHRTLYMQMGADYVKKMSEILKSQINLLRATYEPIASEEFMHCFLQLKNSSKDAPSESGCSVCLKLGTGDSHIFYPENQGDSILIEVQDINQVNHGHATIPISSLIESHGEVTKWFPLYLEEHGCVGKLQLSFTIFHSSDKLASTKMLQGGPVVETMIYDLVLEAAMRAQNIHSRNLHINGHWKWLLNEFADYYGVSNAYTKLRFLSSIMSIATPIKECLELIHEVLLPIIKARGEKSLTRQERSILLDCEDQINNLLTTTFENYKSLDELSPTGLSDTFGIILVSAAPALLPAVQIFTLLHDILSQEAQNILRNYLQIAAAKRCRRHMVETDEFISGNCDTLYTDPMTVSTTYLKMKMLCLNISNEIQADIKIHNQHIFPSSIDLPSITASIYSTELYKRLKGFLAACPPSNPAQHVAELLIQSADFERDLDSWNIRSVHGGFVSKDLFHHYILVWIQDTQLQLLDLCKSEKMLCSDVSPSFSTSTFVEHMYEQIAKSINDYEVVISRWPQYLMALENAVAEVERAALKALEKQYNEILIPLRDGIPKIIEKQVQRLTRRQSISFYVVPNQLGIFLNTLKRILDVLHPGIEHILKCWASCLTIEGGNNIFGEQMNGFTVTLRKKYKKYMQAIVEKLVCNAQSNRTTRLKRILEEAKEAAGESEIRDRMQTLCLQLTDSIHNLHCIFTSRIFVTICRGFWDKMGQIILTFLESRKENRIWYRGSDYALGILDDLFASEMQKLLGKSLQDKDLDPPRSVIEARSILC